MQIIQEEHTHTTYTCSQRLLQGCSCGGRVSYIIPDTKFSARTQSERENATYGTVVTRAECHSPICCCSSYSLYVSLEKTKKIIHTRMYVCRFSHERKQRRWSANISLQGDTNYFAQHCSPSKNKSISNTRVVST